MRCLLSPRFSLLLGTLALLTLTGNAGADDMLKLSSAQIKALRIVSQAIATPGDASGSGLAARVLVPTRQMRIVAAPVSGTLEMLAVAPGTVVRRGDLLARIASPEALMLQRDALQAGSQSSLLQESLRRDEALFKEGLIAESRLQATRAAATQAAALAGERRQGLGMAGVSPGKIGGPLTLVAPIDGVILEQGVQLGQRVEAAALIYRIARLNSLWLEAQLPLNRINEVALGQAVRVAGSTATGKVIAVGRDLDAASQSVLLRAEVDGDATSLVPGQMVEVLLAGNAKGGVRIPASALIRHLGQALVFVQTLADDHGGRFAARPVRILGEGGDSVLVEGLKTGESVVTGGASALKAMLAGVGKS